MSAMPKMNPEIEKHARLARETGRPKSSSHDKEPAKPIDGLKYERGILSDVEDYRAGRLATHSLSEVGKMLNLE